MLALTFLAATLVAGPTGSAQVYINAAQVQAEVDPRFFGLFTEHIGDALDWRLPAQRIKARGFESPHEGDALPTPWAPWGNTLAHVDNADSHPRFEDRRSSSSAAIDLQPGDWRGISQSGIAVKDGETLRFSLWARPSAGPVEVRVLLAAMGDGAERTSLAGDLAEARILVDGDDWVRYEVTLRPNASSFPSALVLLARGEGELRIDQVSLMAADATHGWRPEVVDLYGWLRPGTLRYPGGNFCQTYHFQVGLGPPDERPVVPNPAWSDYPDPNSIGTDEFLGLCEQVGMEPIICFNIGDTDGRRTLPDNSTERALKESLQWIEYCNGDATSEWGRRRAENGRQEPYGVHLWEIGNEIGYGHIHGQLTAEQYLAKLKLFAPAVRAADPEAQIIACGHDPQWNRLIAEQAGDLIDFISIHVYEDSQALPEDRMAHASVYGEPWLLEHIDATALPGRDPVRIALNEWSYSWHRWGGAEEAVAAAGLLSLCLRNADRVAMTNNSDTVARFRNNEVQVFPDSECLAIALLAHHTGREVVRSECLGPTFESNTRGAALSAVDVLASRTGDRLFISLINRAPDDVTAEIAVDGVAIVQAVGAWKLAAESVGARQSFEEPEAVRITEVAPPSASDPLRHELPPWSVTVLEFAVQDLPTAETGEVVGHVPMDGRRAEQAQVMALAEGRDDITLSADADGAFSGGLPTGLYLIKATTDALATTQAMCIRGGRETVVELEAAARPVVDVFDDFTGTQLSGRWTPHCIEGEPGSVELRDGQVTLQGAPNSRFGLLSEPLDLGADEALVIEARVSEIEGLNALIHILAEEHEREFANFLELGIERGHAQTWGPGAVARGARMAAPATLKTVIGPATPSGRSIELSIDGELVNRATDAAWLLDARPRVFLYGYGNTRTVWDFVDVRRVSVPRTLVFADEFDGTELSAQLWDLATVEGASGAAEVSDGRVRLTTEAGGRYGPISRELPQGDGEALVVTATVASLEGVNALACLLGGGPDDFTGFFEGGVERGRAQVWADAWWRTGGEARLPATVRLVAGPHVDGIGRRMRVHVNEQLVSGAPRLPGQDRPYRLFLYGWGPGRTEWDSVRVERVDVRALSREAVDAMALAG